jgi:hypothetical protein
MGLDAICGAKAYGPTTAVRTNQRATKNAETGGKRIAAFAQQQPRALAARRSVRSDTALALPVSVGGSVC